MKLYYLFFGFFESLRQRGETKVDEAVKTRNNASALPCPISEERAAFSCLLSLALERKRREQIVHS